MTEKFSSFISGCRWVAALLVVISHMRLLLFAKQAPHASLIERAFYSITSLGHVAVLLFFVLSGFLVGGITLRHCKTGRMDVKKYAIHRFSRIYTVLIPALVVGWILDAAGSSLFNASGLYSASSGYQFDSLQQSVAAHLDGLTFLGNIVMLENIFVPLLGSNSPMWSIVYEWWYYCLFWLVAASFFSTTIRRKLVNVCGFILLVAILPKALLLYMLIWAIGVGAYVLCESEVLLLSWRAGIATFLVMAILSRLVDPITSHFTNNGLYVGFIRDVIFSIGFGIMILGLFNVDGRAFLKDKNDALADFSYSTYLYHFPFLIFISTLSHDILGIHFSLPFAMRQIMVFLGILLVVYAYAFMMSVVTERHTGKIRSFLTDRLTSTRAERHASI
jgi:peptidoglycan/LPS O-acetylase OafA/YrhL